ncbi:MAG: hypothetical protein ACOY90_21785 [Candidatus Zhuqueibacterota bacterium]
MKNKVTCCIWFALLVFSGYFRVNSSFAQEQAEADIRGIFTLFQQGVDSRDTTVARRIASGKFLPGFTPLYTLLVDGYSRANIPFPLEIGHVKILSDGRAKVETYLNPARNLIIFTLCREDGAWKLCHSEGILLPIFAVPEMPYREVYRIPEDQRGWMMAERDLAFQSLVFEKIKAIEGEQAAMDFFLDGPGYWTAMDAWLPFIEGAAQFALFFTIIENNYYGANYLITHATSDEAEIHCNPLVELSVLQRARFYPKFSFDQFKQLFEYRMRQRAEHCGLEITFYYADAMCRISLKKYSAAQKK